MVMSAKQQVATVFLAVLIVASVMSMPRTLDVPRETPRAQQSKGTIAQAPAATRELSSEQVRDLTYN